MTQGCAQGIAIKQPSRAAEEAPDRIAIVAGSSLIGLTAHAASAARVQSSPLVVNIPGAAFPGRPLIARGHVSRRYAGSRVVLEKKSTRGWVGLAAKKIGPGGISFKLSWTVSQAGPSVKLRVVVLRASRVVASSGTRIVKIAKAGPLVPRPTPIPAAPSGVGVLATSSVASVPLDGQSGDVTLNGSWAVRVGQALAAGVGPNTPDGFLGLVTAVTNNGSQTVASTEPISLPQAIQDGSFDIATFADSTTGATRRAQPRFSQGVNFEQPIGRSVSCSGGGSMSVGGKFGFNVTPSFSASWGFFRIRSANFSVKAIGTAQLQGSVSGNGSCGFGKTGLLKSPAVLARIVGIVAGVPVVVLIEGQIFDDANAGISGSASASAQGTVQASCGMGMDNGSFHGGSCPAPTMSVSPTGGSFSGSVNFGLHVTPTVYLLMYGAGGPEFDLRTGIDGHADSSSWALTVPVNLTASLTVPALGLNSGSLTLYSHDFPLAHS